MRTKLFDANKGIVRRRCCLEGAVKHKLIVQSTLSRVPVCQGIPCDCCGCKLGGLVWVVQVALAHSNAVSHMIWGPCARVFLVFHFMSDVTWDLVVSAFLRIMIALSGPGALLDIS